MGEPKRGVQAVEVRTTVDPAKRPATLLQLPHGFIFIHDPANTRKVAAMLLNSADEVEAALNQESQ